MGELKYVEGRVIVSVNMDWKNRHTFSNGLEIRLERKYENLNLREVNPQNAFVVSAKDIPTGAELLIDYNSTHDTYRLFNYKPLSGEEAASDIKYFSVPVSECYLWRINNEAWQPVYPFTIAERVFEPYTGIFAGITPKLLEDTLYIKSGELEGKVVKTLQACDYAIVFRDLNGQENQIIVCRHYVNEEDPHREEIIAICNDLTEKLENGKLIIGLTPTTAKPLHRTLLSQTLN